MYVDGVIIVVLVVGALAFFLFVGIFAAVFQRQLGTKRLEKFEEETQEGDVYETQRLTPIPADDAQMEYTTETVQPETTTPIRGYPHTQVHINQFTKYFSKYNFVL